MPLTLDLLKRPLRVDARPRLRALAPRRRRQRHGAEEDEAAPLEADEACAELIGPIEPDGE